ncbi:MAG: dihydropteroate synthase [Microcystis sp. M048S1]|uniref:dihydropteroate synthase n=1 Tax=unclassified Microcystis TaxID=2643300 RepID=UPI001192807F|nr:MULTISPECIES: dihydropteroate synthase [unclassified Microcystis]MCA2900920.1 dihydropteroate synthase [Microcystis sp. M035S1]MCA2722634.1 dihydropteroate synthase [Microcystis sp. M176S2]MCA2726026.1 dihydropteroate synthase [Microcystis sp. M166S2]MCA2730453.1 dihydropteroate synthase [Microcystis sp. M162S2]MCA2748259.1 dihydropteroate synthase [Microcystis sp. M155S2]
MSNLTAIREHIFAWGKRTYIMGVLNVTPDSFSDGGEFDNVENALLQAMKMIEAGADIIDIGGQSSRPGAEEISLEAELSRVIPVITAIRQQSSIPISLDTTRAIVAAQGIAAGADLINDISGGTFDRLLLPTVAKLAVPIILMHLRGNPQTMQSLTHYDDLVKEIKEFLQNRVKEALQWGIARENIIIDPGIGFAKTGRQNLELLRELGQFRDLGLPILIGLSRKRFIGEITGKDDPKERVFGTAAACAIAIAKGSDILRVHDVAAIVDVSKVVDAIERS